MGISEKKNESEIIIKELPSKHVSRLKYLGCVSKQEENKLKINYINSGWNCGAVHETLKNRTSREKN